MEIGRSPLVNIPPFGRIFKASESTDPMWFLEEDASQGSAPLFIVSMSPPVYPSAWLRPLSAASVSPGEIIVAPPRGLLGQLPDGA